MATFEYRALESRSHFRILYLNPGAIDAKLSGSLVYCDLNELPHPVYDCLSYVWGSPTLSREILIEDSTLSITANLDSALRRVRTRSPSEPTPIWADGICINQKDIDERNQQVASMKRIYSECRTGIIYLGETADESDLVPEFLETLTESIVKLNRRTNKPLKFDPENEHLFPEENHPGWRRLVALLNRPWFRRIWVIQEFALPPDIQLICGEWERPGTYLAAVLSIPIWDYSYSVFTAITSKKIHGAGNEIAATLALHPLHLHIRQGQGRALGLGLDPYLQRSSRKSDLRSNRPLVWLLRQTSICQATDPRDKMFAIISLAPDATDSSLVADYSESIERVAVRFGAHLVHTGYGLSLLLSSACSNGVAAGFPSWLPDWTGLQQADRFSVWPDRFDKCLDCQIGANPQNQTITVCGYFVDTAQALGLPMGNEDWTDKWMNSIDVLVQNSPAYPTGQSVDEAVCVRPG
jgi:hypothetical protein